MHNNCYIKFLTILFFSIFFITACGTSESARTCSVEGLQVNYQTNPLAVTQDIFFNWQMSDAIQEGQYQTAYRIMVAQSMDDLQKQRLVWDSGKVESDISVAIPYDGESLEAGETYYWRVRVWDKDNKENVSQEIGSFIIGLSEQEWQQAEWITTPYMQENEAAEGSYTVNFRFRLGAATESGFVWGRIIEAMADIMYVQCVPLETILS